MPNPSPTANREPRTANSFVTWSSTIADRLAAGSLVADTPLGPIEYAPLGVGPPVLVLHGRPGGYDQGLTIARSLGPPRFAFLAVSRPGYLRTPLDPARTPAAQADLYAALLDALRLSDASVIALSGGGPSALEFARRHPARCRALALVSTVTRRRPRSQRPFVQKFLDEFILTSDHRAALLHRLVAPRAATDPSFAMLAQLCELPESLRGQGRRNDLDQFDHLPNAPPAPVAAPTLLLHGDADRIIPILHARSAADSIPDSLLITIPGGGHGILLTHQSTVVPALLRFLDDHATATPAASAQPPALL